MNQLLNGLSFNILAQEIEKPTVILNEKYQIVEINPAAEKLLTWSKDLILQQDFFEVCCKDKIFCSPAIFQTQAQSFAITLDAQNHTFYWKATPLIDKSQIKGYFLIGDKSFLKETDRTEQNLESVKQKLAYYERLIAAMPGHVYWKDKDGVYLGSNDEMLLKAGLKSVQDILGKTDYDMPWKRDADKICIVDKEVITSGMAKIVKEFETIADGKELIVLSHKVPIYNNEGIIEGVLGISIDITDSDKLKDKLEAEVRHARNDSEANRIYLENLIAAMPGHVFWKDRNGVYLGSNDSNARLAGLSHGWEMIGKTDYEMPWKDQADHLRETEKIVMKTGQAIVTEDVGEIANNQQIVVLSHKVPLFDRHKSIIGTIGITLDIGELKRTQAALSVAKEKAEMADRAKSDFITNMSHDMRTPFSGLLSLVRYLEQQESDSEKKQYLKLTADTAQSILNLLNEILEMVEIDSGQQSVKSTPFDLRKIVDDIVLMMTPSITTKGLVIQVDYPTDIATYFLGDRVKIHRILLNIMSNALKFTDKGFLRVNVAAEALEKDKLLIKLSVQDTGIGIPRDKFNFIFERFSRLHSSNQGIYQGTGLGLGIVKRYLHDIDGSIDVISEVGVGSTFTCNIPLTVTSAEHCEVNC